MKRNAALAAYVLRFTLYELPPLVRPVLRRSVSRKRDTGSLKHQQSRWDGDKVNGEHHKVTGPAKNVAGRAHSAAGTRDCCEISGHSVDGLPHSVPHGAVPTAMSDAMFPFDDSMVRCFHQTREQEAKPTLPGRSPTPNHAAILRLT